MTQYFKTQGIILSQKESGEADAVISAYTKNYGKIECLAKGLRKINSKLKGLLQPPSLNNLEIAAGKINRLAGASVIDGFFNVKKNLEALESAIFICQLTDKLISHPLKEPPLFINLKSALLKTEQNPNLAKYIRALFQIKLIKILGYEPDFSHAKNKAMEECFKNGKIVDIKEAEKWLKNYIRQLTG